VRGFPELLSSIKEFKHDQMRRNQQSDCLACWSGSALLLPVMWMLRRQLTHTHFFISLAVKPLPHRERPIPGMGIIVEPLVSGIQRLLWMHSRIRVMVLGEANDAFGNNTA
jgi:hypothetical protein